MFFKFIKFDIETESSCNYDAFYISNQNRYVKLCSNNGLSRLFFFF